MTKFELMKQIRDEIVADTKLPLYEERVANSYYPVIGEGSHDAKIIFIGEAPGKNEAETGRPFCGAAGKLLDELLAGIGIPRKEVYITNIVKDRPPGNRDPLPNEIEAYASFLDRQIEIIKPKVISTLGRFSMAYIMKKLSLDFYLDSISRIHGKIFETASLLGEMTVVPFYHPAAAIYDRKLIDILKSDFEVLKKFYP